MVEVVRHGLFNREEPVKYFNFDHGENSGNAAVASLIFVNANDKKDTRRILFNINEARKVSSLPNMKKFVKFRWASNRTEGNRQKLNDDALTQAAVYIWDKVLDYANPDKKRMDTKITPKAFEQPKQSWNNLFGIIRHSGSGNFTVISPNNSPRNAAIYTFLSNGGYRYFDNPKRLNVKFHRTNYVSNGSTNNSPDLNIQITEEESNQKNIAGIIRGKLEQAGRNAKVNNPQISDSDIERLIGIMRNVFSKKSNSSSKFKNLTHSLFTVIPEGETIEHHGILGMKWGVRRYQNRNGSLTPEGKEHYGIQTKRSKGANENEHGEKIDKLQKKYSDKLTEATMQRRSAIHYQNKANGTQASKATRASMAGALDKADKLENKANKISQKAEKKYGSKFEINDKDYKEVYDEVMKYYSRKTAKEISKDRALFLGQNLILGGALGGVLWNTLDLASGRNVFSKYKINN